MRAILAAACTVCCFTYCPLPNVHAQSDGHTLAREAVEVLKNHCYRCHGIEFEVPGLDVSDRTALTASRGEEMSFISPGNLEQSLLWMRVGVERDMPPQKVHVRPKAEEIELVKRWIEAGAEFPTTTTRAHLADASILRAIRDDLQNLPRGDRSHQRYISLHHLWNNIRHTDRDLRMQRAAVVKLLNSVSRSSRLESPPMIDTNASTPYEGTVFRVDLRKFGWESSDWLDVLQGYPYGLSWNERELQELTRDIEEAIGKVNYDGIPFIRADWFVAKASRSRSYHRLLGVPETVEELEQKLGVDVKRDFLLDRVQRAGFAGSGVSHHNRLIDRHEGAVTPYYYRSYDFDSSSGRGVLFRFPLGPKFTENPFNQYAFEHAGGEIIWALPNGLQGYMLIDQDGKRLDDAAPIRIVRDMREIAGTPEIINGLSCIGCHRLGMLDYTDAIAKTQALTSDARSKLESLFVQDNILRETLQSDKSRYLAAQTRVIGPYLQVHEDHRKPLIEFAEPVSTVAKWYDRDMTLADMAAELGFEQRETLATIIQLNQKLKDLGLGPLAIGSAVPRGMWETQEESPSSIFQRAAVVLGLGQGANPLKTN